MRISIPDNTEKEFSEFPSATVSDLKNLASIANKKISELAAEKNILIFPRDLNSVKDKIGDEKIFTLENAGSFPDAKYKPFHGGNKRVPGAADLQQVISYMHILNAREGIFVYPKKVEASDVAHCAASEFMLGELRGMGGTMKMLGMPILQGAKDFSQFAAAMKKYEVDLQDKVCAVCRQ